MNKPHRAFTAVLSALALGACTSTEPIESQFQSPVLGTWAEIVTTGPANASDGRQVIEPTSAGKFNLVFVRTHPAQAPCMGTWSQSGSAYRMTFTSVACFGDGASKPALARELEFELLETSSTRLRFKVTSGVPLAAWQAKLEGGIE